MKNKYDIYSAEHTDVPTKTGHPINAEYQNMFFRDISISAVIFIVIIAVSAMMSIGVKAVHKRIAPYREISEWHIQGKDYAEKKHYIKAVDCYTKAISMCRTKKISADVLLVERGVVYEEMGDLPAALADYETASKAPLFIEALDRKVSLYNGLAKRQIEEGNFSKGMEYYEKGLHADELTVMEWKLRYHSWRRISIYESRHQTLMNCDPTYYKSFLCADMCWIELNNDYCNLKNAEDTETKKINNLDSNYELSYAEWHYGNGNYAFVHHYLDNIIQKEGFEKINDEMKHRILLLKDSIETMLKTGFPFGQVRHTDLFGKTIHLDSCYPTASNAVESSGLENQNCPD